MGVFCFDDKKSKVDLEKLGITRELIGSKVDTFPAGITWPYATLSGSISLNKRILNIDSGNIMMIYAYLKDVRELLAYSCNQKYRLYFPIYWPNTSSQNVYQGQFQADMRFICTDNDPYPTTIKAIRDVSISFELHTGASGNSSMRYNILSLDKNGNLAKDVNLMLEAYLIKTKPTANA